MENSEVNTNIEEKQKIHGVLYEQNKIEQVLQALNTISVVGISQIKAMSTVLDILSSPVPFKSLEEDVTNNTK